jgi:DNA-binding transcriptional LysR family regulator
MTVPGLAIAVCGELSQSELNRKRVPAARSIKREVLFPSPSSNRVAGTRRPTRSRLYPSTRDSLYAALNGTAANRRCQNADDAYRVDRYFDMATTRSRRRRALTAHRENNWALNLELRQLRAFVLLMDRGNMSAAARALGVAQSTMSEGLAALERAIGTRIVERKRGGHGLTLTPAGEALLPHARNVLASLEDAHVAVATVDRDVRARVEVVANESISTYVLPPALRDVRNRWPQLRFSVTVNACPGIVEGLSAARYDVGLVLHICQSDDSRDAHLDGRANPRSVFLADVPLVLVAAAGHPLTSSDDASLRRRLVPYPVFVSDARGHYFDLIDGFFRSDAMPEVRLEATGSVEGVKRSVYTDRRGVGVLPMYAVADDAKAGRLAILHPQRALPHVRLTALLCRERPPLHPAIAALLEAVRAHMSQPLEFASHRRPVRRTPGGR